MSLWGNKDQANNKPTFANTDNSRWYGNCYGVSVNEMNQPHSIPVPNPGWVGIKQWTDHEGNVRRRVEVLVAMTSITGDDSSDDTFFNSF